METTPSPKPGILSNLGNPLTSLIGTVGGIIQNRQNAKVQNRNTDLTIQANKMASEYAYSKDLEMWNRQNEYNSPTAQMDRYKKAGLNPMLIYGQGTASAGQATTLPKYQAPTAKYDYAPSGNIPGMLSQYQDFRLRQAQIDNLTAQADDNRNKAGISAVQKTIAEHFGFSGGGYKNTILGQQAMQSEDQSMLSFYNRQAKQLDYYNMDRKMRMQLEFLQKQNDLMDARISNTTANTMMQKLNLKYGDARNVLNLISGGLGTLGRFIKPVSLFNPVKK